MLGDDEQFVENLAFNISNYFDSVQLLALGSAEDIKVLKYKFDDLVTLTELPNDFNGDQIIVLSIEAFYETDRFLSNFDKITLWFDPYLEVNGEKLDLINSVTNSMLGSLNVTGICARSNTGKYAWNDDNVDNVALLPTLFKHRDVETNVEPLIEKRGITRILVDGSTNISNYHFVESFIALSNLPQEIEVWCIYDGMLKPWMKPDFQIKIMPSNEVPLYLAAVDGVVVIGDAVTPERLGIYLSAGILPIVVDSDVAETIRNIVLVNTIISSFPNFGSIKLLESLASDKETLERYSKLAKEVLCTDKFFDYKQMENLYLTQENIADYFKAKHSEHARKEYLNAKYGDREGSTLHKQLRQDAQIVREMSGVLLREGKISGWTLDKTVLEKRELLVLSNRCTHSLYIKRHDRPDVTDYFKISYVADIGFTARFVISPVDIDEENLIYALKSDNANVARMHTIVPNLNMTIKTEDLSQHPYELTNDENLQGCVEKLNFSNAFKFDITDLVHDLMNLEFRLKSNFEYLSFDKLEISVLKDGELVELEKSNGNTINFSILNDFSKSENVALIVVPTNDDEDGLTCVVSNKNLTQDPTDNSATNNINENTATITPHQTAKTTADGKQKNDVEAA